jgi:hypothetical protein
VEGEPTEGQHGTDEVPAGVQEPLEPIHVY